MAGDPRRKITSGSYPPGRSVQCRTATRNSCAKLASISLTFSLTVNPFLLRFFPPLTVWSLLSFFFFLQALLRVATLSEVIDRGGTQCAELETDNRTESSEVSRNTKHDKSYLCGGTDDAVCSGLGFNTREGP